MHLEDVAVFTAAVEAGSLACAARRLEISAMTASRRLAALEKQLGSRLLHRSTRALSLTSEGRAFWPHACSLLDIQAQARCELGGNRRQAAGLLRISVPTGLGQRFVLPMIPDLLAANPQLRVDVQLSEDIVSLADHGLDLAIRVAPIQPSRQIALKLVDNPRVLCAAPAYVKTRGQPHRLDDLAHHECLRLSTLPRWSFIRHGKLGHVSVTGRLSCNSVEGVRAWCLAGQGIAQLTYWDIRQELARGQLQLIELADAKAQPLAIWAMLAFRRPRPERITAFLGAFKQHLAAWQAQ